jgi:hypothetical protein
MPKRLGRPPKSPTPDKRRVPLSLTVTAEVRKKLEEEAAKRGRSISAECELRLEQTFKDSDFERFVSNKLEKALEGHMVPQALLDGYLSIEVVRHELAQIKKMIEDLPNAQFEREPRHEPPFLVDQHRAKLAEAITTLIKEGYITVEGDIKKDRLVKDLPKEEK